MSDMQRELIALHLHQKVVAYWHDVDFNWGRNATSYYTEDAIFDGGNVYKGREEIEEFYAYRRDRGARVALHAVVNFHCDVTSETEATAVWICMLYAHDGEAPQATAPPINVSKVTDAYVKVGDEWLCKHRKWKTLFKGGAAATILSPEEMAKRKAAKAHA